MAVATVAKAVEIRTRAHGQLVVTSDIPLFDDDFPGIRRYYSKSDERFPGNSKHLDEALDILFDNCPETITCVSVSEERLQIEYTKEPADRAEIEKITERAFG